MYKSKIATILCTLSFLPVTLFAGPSNTGCGCKFTPAGANPCVKSECQTGPTGPKGERGPRGERGHRGKTGSTGATGSSGAAASSSFYCATNSSGGTYDPGSLLTFDSLITASTPAPVTAMSVPQGGSPNGTQFTFVQAGTYSISIVSYHGVSIFPNIQPLYNGSSIGLSSSSNGNPIVFQFLLNATASSTFSVQYDIPQTDTYPVVSQGNSTITFNKLS